MSKRKKKKTNKSRNSKLTGQNLKRGNSVSLDGLDQDYFNTIRDFYNEIVPEDLKVSSGTEFERLAGFLGDPHVFGILAFMYDIMFFFLGTNEEVSPVLTLGKLIIDSGKLLHTKNPLDRISIERIKRRLKKIGFIPFDKKIFCIVQEKPTNEFLDKDEVIVDLQNEDYLNFAGLYAWEILHALKKYLKDTDVIVKVINKKNNPKAFKDYLKLKKIMKKIHYLEDL